MIKVMKALRFFLACMLMCTSASMYAEKVTVSVPEFTPGGQVDMTISLENATEVAAYSMKLFLPEGFSLVWDTEEEDYVYELSGRHTKRFSMMITDAVDGSMLFAVYSSRSGEKLSGSDGELFKVRLHVAETVTASAQASLKSVAISDTDGKDTELDDVVFDLKISESAGITEVSAKKPADVYNAQGLKVRTKATTLDGLPKGLYIVGGRKVVLK